jgi:hypothetical protein
MTTVRALIERSMRVAGVLVKGGSPDADEAQDAFLSLNNMLGGWSNHSLILYSDVDESFSMTGADSYTIGTGGDLDTTPPLKIKTAFLRSGTIDYPLEFIGDDEYARICSKDTQGLAYYLNFDYGYPLSTLKFYPKPDASYTLHLISEKPLTQFTSIDNTVSLPPGWEDAIVYNLAVRLYPEYGQPVDQVVYKIAEDSMRGLKLAAAKRKPMNMQAPLKTRNIYSGYW